VPLFAVQDRLADRPAVGAWAHPAVLALLADGANQPAALGTVKMRRRHEGGLQRVVLLERRA
jgi:hypothetical protein